MCAKEVTSSLCRCGIGVICARVFHCAFRFMDLAANIVSVARLAAPWALVRAPGFAESERVSARGLWVNVAFIVNVPCWMTSHVATGNVILHRFLPWSEQMAVFIHAIGLVEKKPVTRPK